GLGARRLGDLPEYRGLDLEVLEDRFDDEVGGGRGLVDRARGREVVPDRRGRAAREQAAVLESLRLLDEPMVSCGRDLGAPIGDQHGEARASEDLGDAAAHVSGADDGDGGDRVRHAVLLRRGGNGAEQAVTWESSTVRGGAVEVPCSALRASRTRDPVARSYISKII